MFANPVDKVTEILEVKTVKFLLKESGPLLSYTRARIEDESRTLNRPQSLEILGDNADFPVIKRKQ